MKHSYITEESESCPYCEGAGYFQLLLGGSETCIHCEGNGEQRSTKESVLSS
ncbi:YuiA family protein [Halalkalibacter nanhaiisediminis]|uniref:YuiA family protein n=1 Tax=Halalkalibacter nanhaiisediminis TaxID=688079 RepID=UPI001F54EF15|nr:YuiA family protein [Halalkalibacter nanhaiisediminis]